jgi:glycosyltransferase involved in cell wall biosynthesis
MRVLHVIPGIDPRLGGPVAVVAGLAAAQADAGLGASVLNLFAAGDDSSAAESLRSRGVAVTEVGPVTDGRGNHPQLVRTVEELVPRADVVHVHALWETIQFHAARAAIRHRKPYVVTPHGMLSPWSLAQKRLKKWLYMRLRLRACLEGASALHFTSEAERDRAAPLRLRPPAIVEPNGIDVGEFERLPARGETRRRLGLPPDGLLVLFLGRLHPIKALDLLVKGFAESGLSRATLVLAGPDPDGYGAALRGLARAHGVADRVVFTGMLRGAERLAPMADADLFVLPSHHENFGVVVAEALACGCPALVSDQVAIHREIVAGGVGGAFPVRAEAIAAELKRWGGDEALRRAAAAKAPAFARERYAWERIAQRWVGHYDAIVGRGAARVKA